VQLPAAFDVDDFASLQRLERLLKDNTSIPALHARAWLTKYTLGHQLSVQNQIRFGQIAKGFVELGLAQAWTLRLNDGVHLSRCSSSITPGGPAPGRCGSSPASSACAWRSHSLAMHSSSNAR